MYTRNKNTGLGGKQILEEIDQLELTPKPTLIESYQEQREC